ncbi:nucleotidyltransferase family protein [Blautia producta]|nr:nucleotidyltransferase family protein [Blautia producta]
MKAEDKFIIELLMQNTDFGNNEKLSATLDWDYIIHHCTQHELLPVLYNRIKNVLRVPQHIVRILDNEYKIRKHIYSKQRDEYLCLLNELSKAGLKIILLKGVYLAEKCYNDPLERPYLDMDILIQKHETEDVFRVMKSLGYVQGEYNRNTHAIDEFNNNRLIGYESELQHYGEFAKLSGSDFLPVYFVDVHHRLSTVFDSFCYDSDLLFQRAEKENIQGINFWRLSNEDFLLHLSSHLYWHTLSLRDIISGRDIRLLSYFDIALFVSKNEINWEKLFEYARESKLENALYYTLYHCQLIFGNIVPNDIYKTWDMQKVKAISNTIYDRWFTRDTLTPVGKWTSGFMERLFDENRKNEALLSFYNDYINKVLFSGSYFKVIDISAEDRFEEHSCNSEITSIE